MKDLECLVNVGSETAFGLVDSALEDFGAVLANDLVALLAVEFALVLLYNRNSPQKLKKIIFLQKKEAPLEQTRKRCCMDIKMNQNRI